MSSELLSFVSLFYGGAGLFGEIGPFIMLSGPIAALVGIILGILIRLSEKDRKPDEPRSLGC